MRRKSYDHYLNTYTTYTTYKQVEKLVLMILRWCVVIEGAGNDLHAAQQQRGRNMGASVTRQTTDTLIVLHM